MCGIFYLSSESEIKIVQMREQKYEYCNLGMKGTGQPECNAVYVRVHRGAAAVEFYVLFMYRPRLKNKVSVKGKSVTGAYKVNSKRMLHISF